YASKINFPVEQNDSLLILSKGFAITKQDKFRNQQALLVIHVPVGKKIELDNTVNDYKWFNVETDFDHNGWNDNWSNDWENTYSWRSNTEYIMTDKGLKSTNPSDEERLEEERSTEDKQQQMEELQKQKQDLENKQKELEKSLKEDSTRYHYQPSKQIDTPRTEAKVLIEPTKKTNVGSINIHDVALTVIGRATI